MFAFGSQPLPACTAYLPVLPPICTACSGGTLEHPGLLQYSCDLQTSVMPVQPMQIQLPDSHDWQQQQQQQQRKQCGKAGRQQQQQHPEVLDLLLSGKPLVCLAFSDMVVSKQGSGI